MDSHRRANRASWDELVPRHVDSEFYDARSFVAGGCTLKPVELEELGDVSGRTFLHLQCHFGLDTLSWARRGAIVTGIDFSEPAIAAAQRLSAESGVPGRFLTSDVYAAPALLDERFDVVYTSCGALNWLPDIRGWAEVVKHFLAPGGTFYMREVHPVLWSLAEDATPTDLRIDLPYFETPEPQRFVNDGGSYAVSAELENRVTYEWNHGLGEIVTSLIDIGLRIEFLHEHQSTDWRAVTGMEAAPGGMWQMVENREKLPLMYSIRAVRDR
jgi:SAM-dependent methyltransferase